MPSYSSWHSRWEENTNLSESRILTEDGLFCHPFPFGDFTNRNVNKSTRVKSDFLNSPIRGQTMDQETRDRMIKELNAAKREQQGIFNKHAPRAINPDNSDAYTIAKAAFDKADRMIKAIDKEIARLTLYETHDPTVFDKIMNKLGKLVKSDGKDQDSATTGVRG